MTEGNIASWKVKEGDTFVAGDVLLEIETDKASMDVEAQDDGIVAKIFYGDGSQGIKVGLRIGVLAEDGDDMKTLEIPADEPAPAPEPKKEEQPKKEAAPAQSTSSQSAATKSPPNTAPRKANQVAPSGKKMNKAYPLLPSVEHLVKQKGIDHYALENITPTGPKGQLLKGDILAYLGEISQDTPAKLATHFDKISHLDLSNIKVAAPNGAPNVAEAALAAEKSVDQTPPTVKVALPISMASAIEVQKRIQSTLGVFLPLSTFIERAADIANEDLPKSKNHKTTADELFDDVLGLTNVSSAIGVRGHFMPQIQALPATAMATVPRERRVKEKGDVLDFLTRKSRPSAAQKRIAPTPITGPPGTTSVFSVSVQKGDETQAKVFLENLKEILEDAPGRLVL